MNLPMKKNTDLLSKGPAMRAALLFMFLTCAGGAWSGVWSGVWCGAQTVATSAVPAADRRNTEIVHTRMTRPLPVFTTLEAWQKRRQYLRNQILVATGLAPLPPKNDLHAVITGKVEGKGYTIENVLIETFPGFYMGGNLYRPANEQAKHPGVVIPHGHWPYGRLENQPIFSGPALGISLARQGYVAFAYDMVGYTDTLQVNHHFGSDAMRLWSLGPMAMQIWNSIRAVDFIATLGDVDVNDLGATGASGGGSQTFLLAALDERIKFSAPVSMVSTMMQGGDLCENAPGLRMDATNVEYAAMVAPKPMLLVAGTKDWTRNTMRDEYPTIRSAYALYGQPQNVEAVQIEAPHNFNRESREAVYRYFAKLHPRLCDEKELHEHDLDVPPVGQMMALFNRTLPANAVDEKGLFAAWRAMSDVQLTDPALLGKTAQGKAALRERLRQTLHVATPQQVTAAGTEPKLLLTSGIGDRIPAVLLKGKGRVALVLAAEGAAAAEAGATAQALRKAGREVLLVDAFQTGAARAERDRKDEPPVYAPVAEDAGVVAGPRFLGFNVSDDQGRVQDVLTAIRYAAQSGRGVDVYARGDAALWAEFAAAVSEVPVALHLEDKPELKTDSDYEKHFFVPGIRRAGGVEVAERLLKMEPVAH